MNIDLEKSTWKRVTFGDVVRNVNQTVRDAAAAGLARVIAMEHMDPGELRIERWGTIADGTTFTRRVTPGQTLFGKRRAYQRKVAFAEFEAICSGDIYTFESVESQMLSEFLPFVVQSDEFFDHALDTSAGSISPRTNWRDLADFEFDLPPIDEQKRIADLLWTIEASSTAQVERRGALCQARQIWVDREVDRFLRARSVDFADTWASSPDSGYSAVPVDADTGCYVLSLAALGPEGYRSGHFKNVLDSAQTQAVLLREGDLLVSRANTVEAVGRVGIYTEKRTDVSFPDTMMRLNLKADVAPRFAAAVVASSHGRTHMRRSAAGSATSMVKINRTSLGRLPFPAVAIEVQQTFLDQLSRMDEALELVDQDVVHLSQVRKALLTAVLGGD